MSSHELINLTSRGISIKPKPGTGVYLASAGRARLVSRGKQVDSIMVDGMVIPLFEYHERQVLDLPEYDPDSNKIYVVSGLVADHVGQDRDDVWAVGGKLVNSDSMVTAGQWLARWVR